MPRSRLAIVGLNGRSPGKLCRAVRCKQAAFRRRCPVSHLGISAVPRFVILRHELPAEDARGSHWDFMLQWGESLRTWAFEELPGEATAANCRALADHRLAYLDYEGPVSGNRGTVARFDRGEFELRSETAERLRMELHGEKLKGRLTLVRNLNEPAAWTAHWQSEA